MRFLRWLRSLFTTRRVPTPPPPPIAPAVHCVHGVVSHRNSGELGGLKALGVKHARVTYYPKESAAACAAWDWHLPLFDVAGVEPLICVHDFDNATDAVLVMADLTMRYPNRLWQVGNEYDAQPWRGWCHTGAQYAVLMQRIVAACPAGTRFAGMGLASWKDDLVRQPAFLRDYLYAGGPPLVAWCLHTYGVPVLPAMRAKVKATRAILGDRWPLWITEYGIDRFAQEKAWGPRTDAELDEEHRTTVAEVTANAGVCGVSRTYHYCYWDATDTGFGLVRSDESARPAWYALQAVQERSLPNG